ncbi:MAG: Hsp70 family protein [Planctomycetales bacterium]|nr:Hsp70 family protein [Planctomycetales bacterium]NIM09554.1 Hsp70 family protein [Planctomycetales bacterium]NIN09042.1 Hsp70 family protein [Planctomycetales bacterium]NIN78155.1 Hsp70 family protein [Planctomycetales bacterium]NIO35340.1 Hsp70 family protein [Planctomycetales bacterium]
MEFQEGLTVGIDLGTTYSTLAYLDEEGEPIPVENEDGDCETPSLILLATTGHVVVGPNRMRAAMEDPKNVMERVKRHMGETEDDFNHTFDGRKITPEFLSALILKKLKQDAEKKLGKKIGNAVITVPYYFNDLRRKATQDAGRIGGLNVIDIVNEPTAATLTFAWRHHELGVGLSDSTQTKSVLVFDLGGGTFDATVVEYTPTHFHVLATDGDVHLGGIDWNDRLLEYVAEQFKQQHGEDLLESPETSQLMRFECDQAKLALSENEKTSIACRYHGKSMTTEITRAQFEEMTADLTQRSLDTVDLVLKQANVKSSDLYAVVLVGGSTLMPVIGRRLEEELKIKPNRDLSPYTAVAQGAALHAAILEAKHRPEGAEMAEKLKRSLARVRQDDVNSHGLGMVAREPNTNKEINYVMIPRNTQLPAEQRQTFVTNQDGQRRVHVKVIQGEAPDPEACAQIGDLFIRDLPAGLPKGSPVEVIYSFDQMGRIHIRAEDKTSGKSATTQIERSGALDDEQLDALTLLASQYKVD